MGVAGNIASWNIKEGDVIAAGTGLLKLRWLSLGVAGNIASWRKKEGDEIAAGDSIAEIETDKATMEWEAQDDGFVAKILLEDRAKDVPVGEPAMVVVEEKVCSRP